MKKTSVCFKTACQKEARCTSKRCAAKGVARKTQGILAKECAGKQLARQNHALKTSEKICQRASKQDARKMPGVLANRMCCKGVKEKFRF